MKKPNITRCAFAFTVLFSFAFRTDAQQAKLVLNLSKPGANVSPALYGLMTEEINHSYDGGLYGELIRNRIFKDDAEKPDGWSLVSDNGGEGKIELIAANPLKVPRTQQRQAINETLTTCLKLSVTKPGGRVGIANEGFWGIPVRPSTTYKASFYIKSVLPEPAIFQREPVQQQSYPENAFGPVTVSIESTDGTKVYASGTVDFAKSHYWKKYEIQLKTNAGIKPTADARFVISTNRTGTYYFNLVSLFPPTYHNTPNGNRVDIMKLLAAMKPRFLRFPGGNFLEGDYFATRFKWESTLGPLEQRPGHQGTWGYRVSDGMGLLEFLEWCEDLKMQPVLAVYAGYSLNGDHIDAGPLLEPYVQDALNEIEYVTGNTHTYWGAKRAADGHPAPFKLKYVEIGNEDFFDRSLSYDGRFTQFKKAINSKYPNLKCISTIPDNFKAARVKSVQPSVLDEHYYRSAWQMEEDANHYDNYPRKNAPRIFVGEWATREGAPTTDMNAALGDAAWMTGMERNSDIVVMSCYAPLFVNVNPASKDRQRAWQWDSDLIGYNALTSYGSPSYYAQCMFSNNLGNKIVPVKGENIPTKTAGKPDSVASGNHIQKNIIPALYYAATRDTKNGFVYLKVVNTASAEQQVRIEIKGDIKIADDGILTVLQSDSPQSTNTIDHPRNITPITTHLDGIRHSFLHTFKPYSVTVLKIKTTAR